MTKAQSDKIKHQRRLRRLEVERQLQAHHDRFKAGTQRIWLSKQREIDMFRMNRAQRRAHAKKIRSDMRKNGGRIAATTHAQASISLMEHMYGMGIPCVVGFQDNQQGSLDCQVKHEDHRRKIPKTWHGIPVVSTIIDPVHLTGD